MTRDRHRVSQIAFRTLAWVLVMVIAYSTLGPIGLRPKGPESMMPGIEHFAAYFLLGSAFAVAYPKYWWIGFVAVLACAAPLELLQSLVPGRHARFTDFAVKLAGGTAGAGFSVAVLGIIGWIRAPSRATRRMPRSPP